MIEQLLGKIYFYIMELTFIQLRTKQTLIYVCAYKTFNF